jgi:hypothetical protein
MAHAEERRADMIALPPSITLVMMDCTCPDLARLALTDTLQQVEPVKTLVFSNVDLGVPNTEHHQLAQWRSVKEFCYFHWYALPSYVETSHVLTIQWDGWVLDGSLWDDRFADYDWIGAPWDYPEFNVGNGTGIRSMRLMRHLASNARKYPLLTDMPEDALVCCRYRRDLERDGFRWPSEQLAARFAFETVRPAEDSRHFMFHWLCNFPAVLSVERLAERLRLMQASDYVRQNKLWQFGKEQAKVVPRLAEIACD